MHRVEANNSSSRDSASHLGRRRFLQISGGLAASLFLPPNKVSAQGDRSSLPLGPDAAMPGAGSAVTMDELLSAEAIEARSARIEPRMITDYLGKDSLGLSEEAAKISFKKYMSAAQAYSIGGVSEAASYQS